VVTEGKSWDLGFRADFMFGTDAIFTQAYGNPAADVNSGALMPNRGTWDLDLCCNSSRNYGIALPQAFVEMYAPIGNGLNVKAGHFYTPIGYESSYCQMLCMAIVQAANFLVSPSRTPSLN